MIREERARRAREKVIDLLLLFHLVYSLHEKVDKLFSIFFSSPSRQCWFKFRDFLEILPHMSKDFLELHPHMSKEGIQRGQGSMSPLVPLIWCFLAFPIPSYSICSCNYITVPIIFTVRNEVAASNIFTGICQSFCSQGGVWQKPPMDRHPLSRHSPGQTPPGQTPPGRHPTGQTPPGQTPPCPVHAGIHPPAATAADGTHSTGMHSCYSLFPQS